MIPTPYTDHIVSRISEVARKYAPDTQAQREVLDKEIRDAVQTIVRWHDVTSGVNPTIGQYVVVHLKDGTNCYDMLDSQTANWASNMTEKTAKYYLGKLPGSHTLYKMATKALNRSQYITHWRNIVPGIDTP